MVISKYPAGVDLGGFYKNLTPAGFSKYPAGVDLGGFYKNLTPAGFFNIIIDCGPLTQVYVHDTQVPAYVYVP